MKDEAPTEEGAGRAPRTPEGLQSAPAGEPGKTFKKTDEQFPQ